MIRLVGEGKSDEKVRFLHQGSSSSTGTHHRWRVFLAQATGGFSEGTLEADVRFLRNQKGDGFKREFGGGGGEADSMNEKGKTYSRERKIRKI